MNKPIEIFCCVAESDWSFLEQLRTQLALQERQGIIKLWDTSQIQAGEIANKEIQKHLTSARIFVLLISPDFLADECCYDMVMKAALERHANEEAITIPVIVRPTPWRSIPLLNTIQPVPKNGQPINSQSDKDNAFGEVAKEINKAIQRMEAPSVGQNTGVEHEAIPSLSTGRKVSPLLLKNERKKISVILVLAALIILGGGVAFALYVNRPPSTMLPHPSGDHPVPTTTTVPTSTPTTVRTRTLTPSTSNASVPTPPGKVTEFPVPTSASVLYGIITAGPDGNLWFTEYGGNKIGTITSGK